MLDAEPLGFIHHVYTRFLTISGCLWGGINLASIGWNPLSLLGPVLIGLAALWQARTAARVARFNERLAERRYEDERKANKPPLAR